MSKNLKKSIRKSNIWKLMHQSTQKPLTTTEKKKKKMQKQVTV